MNANTEKDTNMNEIIIDEAICNITANKEGELISIDLADNDLIGGLVKVQQRLSKLKDQSDFEYDTEMEILYTETKKMLGSDILVKVFKRENPSILVMYKFFSKLLKIIDHNINKHFGNNINRSVRRENARG
jgi:hypothetical protein